MSAPPSALKWTVSTPAVSIVMLPWVRKQHSRLPFADITTGEFTPTKSNPGTEEKPHGGFVVLTDGETVTTSTFLHAPQGVLPPVREGGPQANCDGKGLDSLEHCFGG